MSGVVECEWLKDHLKDGKVKVVDVAYTVKPKRDWKLFQSTKYGQFEELIRENPEKDYLESHIPGAVHYNIEVGYYPSEFQKLALYPPEEFEKYVRLLGINDGDHVVAYSRGPASGMLFASRLWWTLRVYGYTNVSVLNGGFNQWTGQGLPVEATIPSPKVGNWTAKPIDKSKLVTFEELNTKGEEGESKFDNCEKMNYLDVRGAEQFNGDAPLGVPAKDATGSHVKGSKNLPVGSLITASGLKTKSDLEKMILSCGYKKGDETVLACNGGIQACLASLAFNECGLPSKVYNGSIVELAARASHLINGKSSNKQ